MTTVLASFAHALSASGTAPEWIHLLPAGTFEAIDGRGPYELGDAEAVIAASMGSGRKLPIDENHSITRMTESGGSTPARGWIVEMEAREDGIWGRVEWTQAGSKMVIDRDYGFISPVFSHSKSKPHRVLQIMQAALVNDPGLITLTSLHTRKEIIMDEELRKALGLDKDADDTAIMTAIRETSEAAERNLAILDRMRGELGLADDSGEDAFVTALASRQAKDDPSETSALREQVKALNTQLMTLATATATEKATAAVDAAIGAGKLVPALREHMIARHVRDPKEVATEIAAMPSINAGGLAGRQPRDEGGVTLSAEDQQVCAQMGLDPAEYAKTAKTMRAAL